MIDNWIKKRKKGIAMITMITMLLAVVAGFSTSPTASAAGNVTDSVRYFGEDANGDMILANISVKDSEYGAKGDGKTDDSAAFIAALEDLQTAGGGVLYVPEGRYIIDDVLYIPKNVTMIGEWKSPYEGGNGTGTILLAYFGRDYREGGLSDRPFITMGMASTLKNISIWYPKQTPDDIKPYPWTISFELYSATVDGVTLYNSWQGIDASGSINHVYNVYGTPLKTGVLLDASAEVSEYVGIHFSTDIWGMSTLPNAPTSDNIDKVRECTREAVGLDVRRSDDGFLYDIDVNPYDYPIGMSLSYLYDGVNLYGPSGHAMALHDTQIYMATEQTQTGSNTFLDFTDEVVEGGVPEYTFAESRAPQGKTVVSVKEYGAKGDGKADIDLTEFSASDDTEAIRAAIKAVSDAGGGVVYFPTGAYRITDTITVPKGVELRGVFNGSHYMPGKNNFVSEIWIDFGKGSDSGSPGIILEENSGLKGLSIRHPNNLLADLEVGNVTKYPYTVQGNGSDIYMVNVTLFNSYRGVDLASAKCDNFLLKNVLCTATDISFDIGGGSDGGVMEGCFATYGIWQESYGASGTEEATVLQNHYFQYTEAYRLGDVTNLKTWGIFAFGAGKGIVTYQQNGNIPTNITMWRPGLDTPTAVPSLLLDYGKNFEMYGMSFSCLIDTKLNGINFHSYTIEQSENFEGPINIYGYFTWPSEDAKLLDNGKVNIVKAIRPETSARNVQSVPTTNKSTINIDDYPYKPYVIYVDATENSDGNEKTDATENSGGNKETGVAGSSEGNEDTDNNEDSVKGGESKDADQSTQIPDKNITKTNNLSKPLIVGLFATLGVFVLVLAVEIVCFAKLKKK